MMLFAVLVAAFAVSYLMLRHGRHRDAARWAMAVAMMFAGVSHLLDPASFVQMLPDFMPYRHAAILGTGVIEILFGIGPVVARGRRREVALALIAAHTQLRLARPLVADLRRPWERPVGPGRLTPSRVRRGYGEGR